MIAVAAEGRRAVLESKRVTVMQEEKEGTGLDQPEATQEVEGEPVHCRPPI